ncbi:MAG: hypothetical protein JWR26_3926 [Pedosphaera sp.]|nr:hypothetical protein [Pedosphaera sp.]
MAPLRGFGGAGLVRLAAGKIFQILGRGLERRRGGWRGKSVGCSLFAGAGALVSLRTGVSTRALFGIRQACVRIGRWRVLGLTFGFTLLRPGTGALLCRGYEQARPARGTLGEPLRTSRSELRPRERDPATQKAARDRLFAGLVEDVSKGRVALQKNWRNLRIVTPRAGCLAEILRKVTNATIFHWDDL